MSATLRACLLGAADVLEQSREELCALDAVTGDGDHGVTMAFGARGVRRGVGAIDDDDPVGLIRATAAAMAAGGGAIGALYMAGLTAVGDEVEASLGRDSTTFPPGERIALVGRCARAAATAITDVGHANAGDKTILDALLPMTATLELAATNGSSFEEAIAAAALAAREGAAATTAMVATVGRSARFGEASRGAPDPGAMSFALIVETIARVVGDAPPSDVSMTGR